MAKRQGARKTELYSTDRIIVNNFLALSLVNNKIQEISLAEKLTV